MNEAFNCLHNCFLRYGLEWDYSLELVDSITVKEKKIGDLTLYLFNYKDKQLVNKNHPVLKRCRGLVIDNKCRILNYPFDRFFNHWENEAASIDWNSTSIQGKLDGSLICVFNVDGEWMITTRGSFYPIENTVIDFDKLFRRMFNDKFKLLSTTHCYMFELVSKENRIVTLYDSERIYLIGGRNMSSLCECTPEILDNLAATLDVYRPKYFNANDLDGCKKLFENFRQDEEGLVVVDIDFNRLKIKQECYFKLAKIKMLSKQSIFEYVLGKLNIDEEYLKMLPEVQDEVNRIREIWGRTLTHVYSTHYSIIKDIPNISRKEYALLAVKYRYKSFLFCMYDGKSIIKNHIEWKNVESWNIQ